MIPLSSTNAEKGKMPSIHFLLCTILTVAFGILFASSLLGQVARNTDYSPDKALQSNARINPSTLAMELSIPISGYKGRAGNGLPVAFSYSSKVWQFGPNGFFSNAPNYTWQKIRAIYAKRSAAGWTSSLGTPRIDYEHDMYRGSDQDALYEGQIHTFGVDEGENPPSYPVYRIKRLRVTLADGSSHEFRADDQPINVGSTGGGTVALDAAGIYLSVDGSRMRLEVGATGSVLYMPDGGRYFFAAASGVHAHTFIDAHGNKMIYGLSTRTWIDTMGREIHDPIPMNLQNTQEQTVGDATENFPSIGSGTMAVVFKWRYLKDFNGGESGLEDPNETLGYLSDRTCSGANYTLITGIHLFNQRLGDNTRVCSVTGSQFNPVVLTAIVLPNGQSYQFKYNIHGEMTKITYPTGAYERFVYQEIPPIQVGNAAHDQANRGVSERRVSATGNSADEQLPWTYTAVRGTPQALTPYTVTITAPDGSRTEQVIHDEPHADSSRPYGFDDMKTGRPKEERVYSTANQLVRRMLISYTATEVPAGTGALATRDLRTEREISMTFEPGASQALATMTETIYDTADVVGSTDAAYFSSLNPKQTKKYQYAVVNASTAATANITTAAGWFSAATPATITEIDYLYDANYKARNIDGLAIETRIKDTSGNVKAKSQITYDGVSLLSEPTSTRWENPNTNYRGLVTKTRSWHDIAGNLYIDTQAQYDLMGNLRYAWDGRNNLTQTTYSSTYDYAYPTSVTTPVPDPAGTHGSNAAFTTTTAYDYNTGLPTSTTDINNQTTTMEYNDPLLRPTKATAPNGHQTITDYGAGTSAATRWVKARSQIDGTNWKEAYTWFDGLGRTIRTQSVDDDGDVFALTCYDTMGRVAKATNPFRNWTTQDCSTTTGLEWTSNTYDTAGRPWKVTTHDNAVVETTYSLATSGAQIGTVVTVEDQADKLRRSVTNTLGQLVRVDEPLANGQLGTVAAPNQPTLYTYDTLNNLTGVTQNGTGTEQCGPLGGTCAQTRSFSYDSLSRLKSATNPESGTINYSYDNNGNLTSKVDARTITTAYAYDALNRVKTRTYSGETGYTTPNVSYFYDNLANAKGKLIKVTNGSGADRSTTEYLTFDTMGRVTRSKQTTDGVVYGDDTNPMTYTYNLSGALIEQQYPSGRIVKNTLDTDGSLSQVQSKKASDTYRNYANSFNYTAAGAVSSMRLGNGLWETAIFNNRLQPTQIALGTGSAVQNKLKLDYSYGTTANNGNVLSQTITVPGVTHPFVQTYTYDSLNRIKDATETQNSAQTWKQTFTYDRYGNRNFNTTGGNTTTLPPGFDPNIYNPTVNTANNRFASGQGYAYDASGNTTTDAENRTFTYDAENKQVKVQSGATLIGEYSYDGDGKRIKKVVPNGETTVFVYDAAGKLIGEYSTVVQTAANAKITYTTNDHLGSPRINTDATGQVISRHDYHPFGEEITRSGYGSDTIRKQYTGYECDGETGLDFAQARYHSANLGRFSSPDPYNVILEKERGEDEDERADILIGFISNPQRWNMYVYVVNNPLAFTDPDGQKPRTINVFLDAGGDKSVLTPEGLEAWQKWAADAMKNDKDLTINIYQINANTPGTINAFLDSLKAKDTATIFMGHSTTSNGQRLGIHFNTGGDIGSRGGGLSKTADGVQIQNAVLAIFSCGFGNGFDNITSSNETAFVSIVQGPEATTRSDATNAAAFRFAKSIATGSWEPLRLPGELNIAVAQSQSGINAYPSPDRPSVMAGDHVNYRILPPPRKRR